MDQAGIGEIDFEVAIFSDNPLNGGGGAGELEGNLEGASSDILEDRFRRAGEAAQEITGLGNDRFAGDERRVSSIEGQDAIAMAAFATVEEGDDDVGI